MATSLAPLLDAWNEAHRELNIALDGTPDADLWVRPHPKLLSVGELVGHVAYWQAVWLLGGGNSSPDLSALSVQSPLVQPAFRYYTGSVETPVQLEMSATELVSEVTRVHDAVLAEVRDFDIDTPCPGQWGTWGNIVQYQAFHVAYHTGQVYSVRHLLGHTPEDN